MGHSIEADVVRRIRGLVASVVIATGAVFYLVLCTPAPQAAEAAIVSALIADVGPR